MKYDVKFSCGHTQTVQLFGKTAERERKIQYYQSYGICQECYREMQNSTRSSGCCEVLMSYKKYKESFSACKTKVGSYDPKEKTVIVYVPKEGV